MREGHGKKPVRRRSRIKNLLWAAFFFVLGVIGLMLPIVPQVPFFIMSLLFLALAFPRIRKALRRFLHRHPKIAHAYKTWRHHGRKKRHARIRKHKERTAKTATHTHGHSAAGSRHKL